MNKSGMAVLDRLRIIEVRGQAVMLDSELALLYGVETGQFNRAMKRNSARFPADFAFQLTKAEWDSLSCQIGTLKTAGRGQHRKYLPWYSPNMARSWPPPSSKVRAPSR